MKDLWGFHKSVHEDDWNDGQNLTVKVKNSSSTAVSIAFILLFFIFLLYFIQEIIISMNLFNFRTLPLLSNSVNQLLHKTKMLKTKQTLHNQYPLKKRSPGNKLNTVVGILKQNGRMMVVFRMM